MRFSGEVGYVESTQETPPGSGIWVENVIEKVYSGDIIQNIRQLETAEKVNSDISVQNSISVVADQHAYDHFHQIRYVRWAGVTWIVTSVKVQAPRLILSLGGVYNGPTA